MQCEIDAAAIIRFHDRQLRERDWPVMSHIAVPPGPWECIDANHRYNGLLRHEESRLRRLDVPPSEIAAGRRLIERYERKRKAALDAIDAALPAAPGAGAGACACAPSAREPGACRSSATAGAMIDRLSVLALDLHQVRAQAQRAGAGADACGNLGAAAGPAIGPDAHANRHVEADEAHARACAARLERLHARRRDLQAGLDTLLAQARAGLAHADHVEIDRRRGGMSADPSVDPSADPLAAPGRNERIGSLPGGGDTAAS